MTSKLTREETQQIIDAADAVITALAGANDEVHKDDTDKMVRLWDDLNDRYAPPEVVRELARTALAAMDSETVSQKEPISFDEWSRKCALQITLCYPDFREKAQYIWDSARETQQPAPKYPEVLPCSVLLEPGLRFGKGIKTSTMLAALARRAVHESDMAALSPEERAEFKARIEDLKSLIAQPAPVVPDRSIFEQWWESQNGAPLDGWDSLRTIDGYCDDGIDGQFEAWNACRAAMLNGGKS